jgi:ankyrin repeat protein
MSKTSSKSSSTASSQDSSSPSIRYYENYTENTGVYDEELELEEMKKVLESTQYPLHEACLLGDPYLQITESFLDKGADIHALDSSQTTPIITAANQKAFKTVSLLVERGANPNSREVWHNRSVLHLISTGLDDIPNIEDYTALVSELLPKITDLNAKEDLERTVLHFLCNSVFLNSENDQAEIVIADLALKLIKFGCDHNARDAFGNTALHLACAAGNAKIAKALMPMVEELDTRNHEGNSYLHLACKNGHVEIVEMILQNSRKDRDPEYEPCKNERGQTPLHLACSSNHLEIVEILLENGFDIRALDNAGNSALVDSSLNMSQAFRDMVKKPSPVLDFSSNSAAPKRVFEEMVARSKQIIPRETLKLKIESCASIEDQTEKSNSLISAFREMCEHLEKDLNDFGDDFDIGDPRGYTIFMLQREAFVQKIVQNLDSNIADDSQTTILHLLCQYGYGNAAELLIKKGEDLEYKNNQGQTALHIACQHGHVEIARLLIRNGCDKNAVNTLTQETPFETALNNAHYDVAMILVKELYDESLKGIEEGRRTEITDLGMAINHPNTPSSYPKTLKSNAEKATLKPLLPGLWHN